MPRQDRCCGNLPLTGAKISKKIGPGFRRGGGEGGPPMALFCGVGLFGISNDSPFRPRSFLGAFDDASPDCLVSPLSAGVHNSELLRTGYALCTGAISPKHDGPKLFPRFETSAPASITRGPPPPPDLARGSGLDWRLWLDPLPSLWRSIPGSPTAYFPLFKPRVSPHSWRLWVAVCSAGCCPHSSHSSPQEPPLHYL
jgi:hypothetical protein